MSRWNVDTILNYFAQGHCPYVDQDNDGQIILYTGLWETEDGELTDEPPEG